MVDLNGHEAGNGGHSQGKPTAYRDSSTRRDGRSWVIAKVREVFLPLDVDELARTWPGS
jgi:hypothetical protein